MRILWAFLAGLAVGAAVTYALSVYLYEVGPFAARHAGPATRPAAWAEAIALPNLPNLHRVSPGLYRGAQPSQAGFADLKALGVRTVVNLRLFGSDRQEAREAGLEYVHIAAEAWDADEDEVVEFLKIVTDPARGPVFVHCTHGADRTGLMVAIYRIVVQHWPKDEAVREMTEGGFGFHPFWDELVEYLRAVDVEGLRRKAGMEEERSP